MRNRFKILNRYLDNNYYLNNKNNYYFLKTKIKKNNKLFLNKMIEKGYEINNIKLDNDQCEGIYTDETNTLVLASAGSGKTLTIASKINYLIKEKNIDEHEILCLSFTNEAVNNLKNKIEYNIDIFTFHKLSLEILNDYKYNYCLVSDYLSYIINEIFLSSINNIDNKTLNYFNNNITNFINLFKNYNYDYSYLNKIKINNKLITLIKKIYLIYEEELASSNIIDFNDVINLSIKLIKEKGLKRYYKYIIIDEFQDISYNKLILLKTIKESCSSKIFAVGDDYQSIYRFSGSNIDIIRNFKKYFGYCKTIKIKKTYRNSYELANISNRFILKNKNQVKKNILSDKHINKPIKIIYYNKNMIIKLEKILSLIDTKVLILSRNNVDFKYINNLDDNKIRYMTMHKSKGIEEENVIIINLCNKYFPSKINNEIDYLLIKREKYLYEEERRLFYVALTRTKNYVYLLVDKENPSIFIKELININKKYIEVLDL